MQCNAMQCNGTAQRLRKRYVMLRSLHTVSSGARHAIQPHLLSIQFVFYAVLFIKRRQSPTLRKNALLYTHPCTVSWNATIQCNVAQPNVRKNTMSCSVPCIRCLRALAMLLECNANAMQSHNHGYICFSVSIL